MSLPVSCLKSDATAPSSRKPTLSVPAMLAGSPPTVMGTLSTCSMPSGWGRNDDEGEPPSAARTDGSADAVVAFDRERPRERENTRVTGR